jgi:hypothetical protein
VVTALQAACTPAVGFLSAEILEILEIGQARKVLEEEHGMNGMIDIIDCKSLARPHFSMTFSYVIRAFFVAKCESFGSFTGVKHNGRPLH